MHKNKENMIYSRLLSSTDRKQKYAFSQTILKIIKYIFIFFMVFKAESAFSEEAVQPVMVPEGSASVGLASYMEYIKDETGKLSFEEVSGTASGWKSLKGNEKVNFGYSPFYYWLRFKVKNEQKERVLPIFEISFPRQDYIEFYYHDSRGNFRKKITGDTLPFSSREMDHIGFAFELRTEPLSETVYYIRTRSTYNRSLLNPFLHSQNSFHKASSERNLMNGMLYGLLGIMMFYNFFLFITIRERVHLYSSLTILFFSLNLSGIHGSSYQYLYPDWPWLQNVDYVIFSCLTMICLILYSNEYLDLKLNMKKAYQFTRFLLAAVTVLMFVFLFMISRFPGFSFNALLYLGFFFLAEQIFIGTYLSLRKVRAAYFYMASFSIFFISLLISLLSANYLISSSSLSYWAFQLGFSSMLILLSLGIADKINVLKKGLIHANENLENKVEKRTSELKEALNTINYDLKVAQKIQANILPKEIIQLKNMEGMMQYMPLEKVGGDFCDIFEMENGIVRIFLADATGHGVQAALMTMSIHSEYQNIKEYPLNPAEVLTILNQHYYHRYYYLNAYFTCILIDINFQEKKLIYASAGHPQQILFSGKEIFSLTPTGKLMGVLNSITYKEKTIENVEKGRLVLFTDGIFEEFNKDGIELGEDNFISILREKRNLPLDRFMNECITSMMNFLEKEPRQDDITLITLDWKE